VALLPFLLERRARLRGAPVRFSSLYLLDRARRSPQRRRTSPARWLALLQALAILFLVLAASRPVAPGGGDPASHRPTRAVVALDVSASMRQGGAGGTAWEELQAAADSILALAGPGDRMALAAVADRVVGWWEGPPATLRRRLAALAPTARASDWPAALEALASRLDDSTESYLLTDGSHGTRPPEPGGGAPGRPVLRTWAPPPEGNRGLAAAAWQTAGTVGLEARAWGAAPAAAIAGRRSGEELREPAALALGGGPAGSWTVPDTATFAFAEADRHPFDDRRWVARGSGAGQYRVARWAPPDDPPEPGALFWEAAVAAAPRGAEEERVATLAELAARPPHLALLPLRAYRPGEAALLAGLAEGGTRLLFAPTCADPACVPGPGWLPGSAVPDVAWALGPEERQATLAAGPERSGAAAAAGSAPAAVPAHLVAQVPVRGSLRTAGGPAPDLEWRLSSGAPALWARGAMAVWLVPLGPPATRLGTTPVFPLVADAALAAWDPRWGAAAGGALVGEALPVPAGAVVTGPLHDPRPRRWEVAEGSAPPRPEAPGLYRVEAGATSFVAVNADAAEGDLTPVPPAAWRAAWGVEPTPPEAWQGALFRRRRGPELWPWALVLALAALAGEAALRRRA